MAPAPLTARSVRFGIILGLVAVRVGSLRNVMNGEGKEGREALRRNMLRLGGMW